MQQWYSDRSKFAKAHQALARDVRNLAAEIQTIVGALENDPHTGRKPVTAEGLHQPGFRLTSCSNATTTVEISIEEAELTIYPSIMVGDQRVNAIKHFRDDGFVTLKVENALADDIDVMRSTLIDALILGTLYRTP